MPYSAFIELTNDTDPAILEGIVYGAYRASSGGRVALWLRGVSPQSLRAALDRAVSEVGTRVSGVEFLVTQDLGVAAETARQSSRCLLATADLDRFQLDPERTVHDLEAGIGWLGAPPVGAEAGSS
ncbi:MAG TPA: hypothetical protein VLA09_12715 [Longimicrobiales bacterium]|nr:hypothetical protein [Longimicrobiales bacterium]